MPDPLTLDTNVVLDLLRFHDPSVASLHAALTTGRLICLGDRYALNELERVLTYPQLALPAAQAEEILRAYRDLMHDVPGSGSPVPLPLCRDPDDQPFLELAARGKARWLVSKDKKVLELARSRRHALPFAILHPRDLANTLAAFPNVDH